MRRLEILSFLQERYRKVIYLIIILKRLDGDRICNVSVGEGIVIPVTKDMVSDLMRLWEVLEEGNIEIDIEEVVGRKINLYYGN